MPMTPGNDFTPFELDDILEEEYDAEHGGRARRIHMDNGNIVHIKCEDPYGFWMVSLEKGNLPDKLKGAWTTFQQALAAVNQWLRDKPEPYIPSKEVKTVKKINKDTLKVA